MKIKLISQIPVNLIDRITYTFSGDVISAEMDGIVEEYDFSELPDGRLEIDLDEIITALGVFPIISAERKDGELWVELLHYVGVDAGEEVWIPEWIDPGEYTPPTSEEEEPDTPEEPEEEENIPVKDRVPEEVHEQFLDDIERLRAGIAISLDLLEDIARDVILGIMEDVIAGNEADPENPVYSDTEGLKILLEESMSDILADTDLTIGIVDSAIDIVRDLEVEAKYNTQFMLNEVNMSIFEVFRVETLARVREHL